MSRERDRKNCIQTKKGVGKCGEKIRKRVEGTVIFVVGSLRQV